jgi:hypothetical protein
MATMAALICAFRTRRKELLSRAFISGDVGYYSSDTSEIVAACGNVIEASLDTKRASL